MTFSTDITGILVLAEHNDEVLQPSTLTTLSAARLLPGEITVLLVGRECSKIVKQVETLQGVSRVLVAESSLFEGNLAEVIADLMQEIGKNYQYILAGATSFGKNILPRVAALLDVAQISDVIAIISADTFTRPIYAGNALMTLQSLDPIKVMTIRSTAFSPIPKLNAPNPTLSIERISYQKDLGLSTFLSLEASSSQRPELTSAKRVVSGGRGLQSRENFKLIEELADILNAAIGASRAAVDAGFISNDFQVGQTGKVVAPELYIAVGISGAIQHLAGMKDSKVIVAINKDPDAPIFQLADYALVGDLFKIVPELSHELTIRRRQT